MPEPISGENLETPTPAATGESQGNVENSVTPDPVTPIPNQEQPPTTEAEKTETVTEETQKVPEHFRKGYDALEKDVKEKYKPLAEAVEQAGGLEVITALKPLADLILNENADPATVVQTLKETLLPQHMEAVAWAALDSPATQAVILEDPDVRQAIADSYFNGRSIEEVQAALNGITADDDLDPETKKLRQEVNTFKAEQKKSQDAEAARAAQSRTQDLEKRFFVDTAADVVRQFNLAAPDGASEADKQLFTDTVEDFQYAAQGRFLKENSGAYLQIQDMYSRGLATQARIAEARLHNKWQATLIKTAERYSTKLQAYSDAAKLTQEQKQQEIRPDTTGNVPNTQTPKQERYDLNDPDWLNKFLTEFKRDAATVGA